MSVVFVQNSVKSNAQKEVVMCKFKDCIKHAVPENEYCIKHQKQAFIDETIAEGKKVCVNHIRGCRAKLETDYKFSMFGKG
jgi:hypothetical protein